LSDADELALARLVREISWRIDHVQASTVHELLVEAGKLVLDPDEVLGGRAAIRHVSTNFRFVATGADTAERTTLVKS
jgi:hypothetical protein